VESDVVLAHELVQLDVLGVLPPALPLVHVVGSNGNVADRSIEPHIEDLLAVLLKRNRGSPLEVTRDASALETTLQEVVSEGDSIGRPVGLDLLDPLLELRLDLGQIDEDVGRGADFGSRFALVADGLDELDGVDKLTTAVALISLGIMVMAHGALTANEAISQEAFTLEAILLVNHLLEGVSVLVKGIEDVLSNLGLLGSGSSSELVEVTVEPLVDISVDGVVVIANLLRGLAFLHRLSLSGGSIFISSANVHGVMASKSRESGIHVGREHASDNVSQMRHVVNVGECTSDEDVSFAFLGKLLRGVNATDLGLRGADRHVFADFLDARCFFHKGVEADEVVLGLECLELSLDFLVKQLDGGLEVREGEGGNVDPLVGVGAFDKLVQKMLFGLLSDSFDLGVGLGVLLDGELSGSEAELVVEHVKPVIESELT